MRFALDALLLVLRVKYRRYRKSGSVKPNKSTCNHIPFVFHFYMKVRIFPCKAGQLSTLHLICNLYIDGNDTVYRQARTHTAAMLFRGGGRCRKAGSSLSPDGAKRASRPGQCRLLLFCTESAATSTILQNIRELEVKGQSRERETWAAFPLPKDRQLVY